MPVLCFFLMNVSLENNFKSWIMLTLACAGAVYCCLGLGLVIYIKVNQVSLLTKKMMSLYSLITQNPGSINVLDRTFSGPAHMARISYNREYYCRLYLLKTQKPQDKH